MTHVTNDSYQQYATNPHNVVYMIYLDYVSLILSIFSQLELFSLQKH